MVKTLIRNNLAILLAERQLKITRVSKDTGISRSTVTSIAQNDTKMMQLEVIAKLCMYLNIEPKDFFSYIPIDFEFTIELNSFDFAPRKTSESEIGYIDLSDVKFDLFIDVNKKINIPFNKTYELKGLAKNYDFMKNELEVYLNFENKLDRSSTQYEQEFLSEVWELLDISFKLEAIDNLEEYISNAISKAFIKEINLLSIESEEKKRLQNRLRKLNSRIVDGIFLTLSK